MVFVHFADAAASNGATKTCLVGNQVFFAIGFAWCCHGFCANVFSTFKLIVAVVASGQGTHFVDHAHQHLRAHGWQTCTSHTVFGKNFFLLVNGCHEGFGIVQIAHTFGATHSNRLEVFAAHDSAHARTASGTVHVVYNGCKQDAVFTGFANARNTS